MSGLGRTRIRSGAPKVSPRGAPPRCRPPSGDCRMDSGADPPWPFPGPPFRRPPSPPGRCRHRTPLGSRKTYVKWIPTGARVLVLRAAHAAVLSVHKKATQRRTEAMRASLSPRAGDVPRSPLPRTRVYPFPAPGASRPTIVLSRMTSRSHSLAFGRCIKDDEHRHAAGTSLNPSRFYLLAKRFGQSGSEPDPWGCVSSQIAHAGAPGDDEIDG
jgi:hypothetical protein